MFNQRRFRLTSSALAAVLCVAATLTATAASRASVAISADRQMLSRSFVEQEILRQAKAQGVRLSPAEARSAADQAMNDLTGKGPGPQKLIIHLKFKKFTICISTGADKGYCKGGGRSANN
ncbi:MAG: hypothetical protein ACK4TL_11810 [Hyphomicrobiaceae bacterium]